MRESIRITFLGQAGFLFETPSGFRIGVDLYLSDCCARYFGFKRLLPYLVNPDELSLDWLIATHAHYDHFDPDSVPRLMSCPRTRLIAARDCGAEAQRLGLERERITYIGVGDSVRSEDAAATAIPCDHGELAPDAVGLLLETAGKRIVVTGDTAFRADYFRAQAVRGADLFILPINGAFGNMNETEAAEAVQIAEPKLAVPCHYWNFAEHGGDPGLFAEEMKKRGLRYLLMRPGEELLL